MRRKTKCLMIFCLLTVICAIFLLFSLNKSWQNEVEKSKRTIETYLKTVFNEYTADGNKDDFIEKISALKDSLVRSRSPNDFKDDTHCQSNSVCNEIYQVWQYWLWSFTFLDTKSNILLLKMKYPKDSLINFEMVWCRAYKVWAHYYKINFFSTRLI
jgi:hypothetical protein